MIVSAKTASMEKQHFLDTSKCGLSTPGRGFSGTIQRKLIMDDNEAKSRNFLRLTGWINCNSASPMQFKCKSAYFTKRHMCQEKHRHQGMKWLQRNSGVLKYDKQLRQIVVSRLLLASATKSPGCAFARCVLSLHILAVCVAATPEGLGSVSGCQGADVSFEIC